MELCIGADALRAALKDIEAAEANGFHHCQAVFTMTSAGPALDNCRAVYSDLSERAHPDDPHLNWGRFQGVTKRFRFADGKLQPLSPEAASKGVREDGGPAFPRRLPNVTVPPDEAMQIIRAHEGMSQRDYFAAHAPLPPAQWTVGPHGTADDFNNLANLSAQWAYVYADAMLKARQL